MQRHIQHRQQSTNQAPIFLQHSASKLKVSLSWYLAWQGWFDRIKLGMEKLGAQVLMATLDKVQLHRFLHQSRVVFDSRRARMLSQYLCCTETPDSVHIVHIVQIQGRHHKIQWVLALIDCCTTSISMTPRLLQWLGISHDAIGVTTVGLNREVMPHAKASWKLQITVKYLD